MKLEWKYAKDLAAGDLIAWPWSAPSIEARLATVVSVKPAPVANTVNVDLNPGGMYPMASTAAVHVYRTTP